MSGRHPSSVGGCAVALVAAVLAAGCATTSPAPPAWQRTSAKVATSPYGAWTNVKLTTGAQIAGELLAVADSAVYLGANPVLYQVPVRCVDTLTIADQEVDNGPPLGLGLAGLASTLTHGFSAVISVPVWIITTVAASTGVARAGYWTIRPLSAPRATAATAATAAVVTPVTVGAPGSGGRQTPVVAIPPPREPDIASTAAPPAVDTIPSAAIDPGLREAVEFARFPQGLRWEYVQSARTRETLNETCARVVVMAPETGATAPSVAPLRVRPPSEILPPSAAPTGPPDAPPLDLPAPAPMPE